MRGLLAIKVEQQHKRRGVRHTNQPGSSSSSWRLNVVKREDNKVMAKPKFEPKQEAPKQGVQGTSGTPTTRARDIKCFRCQGLDHVSSQFPKKWVMILTKNSFISNKHDANVDDTRVDQPHKQPWDSLELPKGPITMWRLKAI